MIEEGDFESRPPRATKRMGERRRAEYLKENPPQKFGFRVRTGIRRKAFEKFEGEDDMISERSAWCRRRFGYDQTHWNLRWHPKCRPDRQGELCYLFRTYSQAMEFFVRWG